MSTPVTVKRGDVAATLDESMAYARITVADALALEVRGAGCVKALNECFDHHGHLFALDEPLFLALAESWMKTRGFAATIFPAPEAPWWERVLARFLIWFARRRIREAGLRAFDESGRKGATL